MTGGLTVFENSEFGRIRTLDVDGEPWFVGRDVAEALGYGNTKDAIATHVDEDDKQLIQRSENTTFEIPNRGMTIINESGIYSLIFGSRLESAKRFKHWVTGEVLPSIRRNGAYGSGADYFRAASIIAGCPDDRLECVRFLLGKAGIEMPGDRIPGAGQVEPVVEAAGSGFGEFLEPLRALAWGNGCRSVLTCQEFNGFCAQHGIPPGKFRRWLYRNGHIMASVNGGKTNYSMTVWVSGSGCRRCIVFSGET